MDRAGNRVNPERTTAMPAWTELFQVAKPIWDGLDVGVISDELRQ